MRRDRVCQRLEEGTTIESRNERTLWTKILDGVWDDGTGALYSDRQMDEKLAGGAQVIIVDKGLTLRPIPSYDLEEGDYVVMTWGFWWEGDTGDRPLFDQEKSQLLLRVAGWNNSDGDDNWVLMLDAPESLMNMIEWSLYQGENGYDHDPILLYVGPETIFHYVEKGQGHDEWDDEWNWSYQYDIYGPPEEPSA